MSHYIHVHLWWPWTIRPVLNHWKNRIRFCSPSVTSHFNYDLIITICSQIKTQTNPFLISLLHMPVLIICTISGRCHLVLSCISFLPSSVAQATSNCLWWSLLCCQCTWFLWSHHISFTCHTVCSGHAVMSLRLYSHWKQCLQNMLVMWSQPQQLRVCLNMPTPTLWCSMLHIYQDHGMNPKQLKFSCIG